MHRARITIFAGHYGSGKTTLAVNDALRLKQTYPRVTLCDLDIVNPYFRTADALDVLTAHDIQLIASPFANSNVDAPALPAATRAIIDDPGIHAVIDLGGDDRGAFALGRYAKALRQEGCDMLLVFNPFRPLTRDLESLAEIRAEIETAAKVPFTGIINNANLGAETTLDTVLDTVPQAEAIATALGLPLRATAIWEALLPARGSPAWDALAQRATLWPITRYGKKDWQL